MSLISRIRGVFRRATPEQRNDRLVASLVGTTGRARRDAWQNILTRIGTRGDKRTAGEFQCVPVTNLEARELWRADDIAKRVIELRPRDRMRRGYDVKLDKKKQSEDVQAVLEHLKANRAFVRAGQQENAYGGSVIFPVINDSLSDLARPLEDDAITLPKAFHVFEPRQLQPIEWDDDVMSETFGEPSLWRMVPIGVRSNSTFTGLEIHASRFIVFPGIRVSIEQPTGAQYGWGDSVLTPMRDVLRDFNLSWGAAVTLLQEMGQGVFKMAGLAQMVAQDKDDEIERRIMILDIMRSAINSMVIGGDDDFTRIPIPMNGMPDVLQQFCTRLAAAADMPVTKLMGQSPAGMNATGESDITIYDDSVDAWGDEHMPQLERLVRMILLAKDGPLSGKEPKNWSLEYRPLRQPTEIEKATLRKTVAETDKINIGLQIYSEDDAAKSHYGGDTYSPEVTIDWKAREEQKAAMEKASADALAMQQAIMEKAAANGNQATGGDPTADPGADGGDGAAEPATARGDRKAIAAYSAIRRRSDAGDFDESKHPRAPDGKFGESGGSAEPKGSGGAGAKALTAREHQFLRAASTGKGGRDIPTHEAASLKASIAQKLGLPGHTRAKDLAKAAPREKPAVKPAKAKDEPKASKDEPKRPAAARGAPEIPAEHRVSAAENAAARQRHAELKEQFAQGGHARAFNELYGEHFTPREDKRLPTPKEYLDEQKKFSETITKQQVFAFQHYEGSNFDGMNNYMRGKSSEIRAIQKEAISDMHAALRSNPRDSDLVSFRGAAVPGDHPLAALKPGDSFVDKAFTSSTIFKDHAEGFAKGGEKEVHFVITSPKGTHVAPMAALHPNAREGEFVHDTNTKFTITHREDLSDGGIRYHVQADTK